MKNILFASLLLFSACADIDPLPPDSEQARQFAGRWYQYPNKNWEWHFLEQDDLRQYVFDSGDTTWESSGAWRVSGDTLLTASHGIERAYIFYFFPDSSLILEGAAFSGLQHKLIRI